MQGHYTPFGVRMSYRCRLSVFGSSLPFASYVIFSAGCCPFPFTHVFISGITKQAAQRRQLQPNNRRSWHPRTDSATRCADRMVGGTRQGYKKGGRGELWKRVLSAKVGTRARRSASSISTFLISVINFFSLGFLCFHLSSPFHISHPMSKVKKVWSGTVAKKYSPVGALVFGVITTV
ncbi:hypothetical protein V8C44DRAFT_267688 [Trichoderma aethiopicum]